MYVTYGFMVLIFLTKQKTIFGLLDVNVDNKITYFLDDDFYIDTFQRLHCQITDSPECRRHLPRFWAFEPKNFPLLQRNFPTKKIFFIITEEKVLTKAPNKLEQENFLHETLHFNDEPILMIGNGTFDNFIALKKLNILNTNLKNISENVLTEKIGLSLEQLNLRNNQLEFVSSNAFKYLKNLTSLNLNHNKGIKLYETKMDGKNISIFTENLSTLKYLDLSFCNISFLPEIIFTNLISLKTLLLNGNPFHFIPTAIRSLSNLRSFRIHRSYLSNLSQKDFMFNQKLENIDARLTKITRINDCTFCDLINLKKVDLSYNRNLSFIHENAFGLISTGKSPPLEYFKIRDCNISILQEKLLDWKTVNKIEIQENPLTCNCSMAWIINAIRKETQVNENKFLSKTILKSQSFIHSLRCQNPPELKNIKFYNLAGNFCANGKEENYVIEDDSDIIYACGEDRICSCGDNYLQCYIEERIERDEWNRETYKIINLKNIKILRNDNEFILKEVSFDGSSIKRLEKDKLLPGREKFIEEISFVENQIESIENGIFDKFISLKSLTISKNFLTNIPENAFIQQLGLTLKKLNLSYNKFTNLTPNVFKNLIKLKYLSLEGNKNIQWSKFIFPKTLENLEIMDLSNCNISKLQEFSVFKNLQKLRLKNNPLNLEAVKSKSTFFPSTLITLNLDSCGLSNLDENIFINLTKLQNLILNYNNFTCIPKAIGVLSNLRNLHLSNSWIENIKFGDLQNNSKLETLKADNSEFRRIENCAFCNLPNLKNVDLNGNDLIEFIHENAFGYVSNEFSKVLETFSIDARIFCFLSENLLDWNNIENIDIRGYDYPCNCSSNLSWLLKDLRSTKPKYLEKFLEYFRSNYKKFDEEIKESFYDIPDCRRDASENYLSLNKMSNEYSQAFWWMLRIFSFIFIILSIGFGGSFIIYVRRYLRHSILYR